MKTQYIIMTALSTLLIAISCEKEPDYYNADTTEPVASIEDSDLTLGGNT